MAVYRSGLVLKARALQIAVSRGLQPFVGHPSVERTMQRPYR
jgi:hypothetical protein